ncbi:LamB/YcsF family protein [Vibrio sp. ZSDZ34]|jgi:UPF0271 protein|uniref:LamB/YcsF family protein n=1 Tax=Vibrio gelatinilyticus TaxID=2893468 RepID=A0A9X2AXH0_9VIBR|nr:5-oxoprolinase subunit PxpA [Vibrio gelatinilyticus]MCJ2375688.1 LamB/YcsF family protein [Vibrio gelatinilyticus]
MKLNGDVGESFGHWKMGNDEALMPFLQMANIACGFHAADPDTIMHTLQLAKRYQVTVGAHPSYHDQIGFGRRSIPHSNEQITNLILYQVGALQALAHSQGMQVQYIKPHGALYNDMMNSAHTMQAVFAAAHNLNLPVMLLATAQQEQHLTLAKQYNISLIFEAFADRRYTVDGTLTNRGIDGALLTTTESILSQAKSIIQGKQVLTHSGEWLSIKADTLCVHGDSPHSIEVAKHIREVIEQEED